jgi:hypothetical protein
VDISVSIVWTAMLEGDSEEAATAATAMVPDACHYYDPDRRVGRAIARRMGGEGKIAWDIYLFFTPESTWGEEPPLPADWVHQLQGAAWADPVRYHRGDDLVAALDSLMRRFEGADVLR